MHGPSFEHWNITQTEHGLILNLTCIAQASERELKQWLGECSEIFSEIGNYKSYSISHYCLFHRAWTVRGLKMVQLSKDKSIFFFFFFICELHWSQLLAHISKRYRFVHLWFGPTSTRISGGFREGTKDLTPCIYLEFMDNLSLAETKKLSKTIKGLQEASKKSCLNLEYFICLTFQVLHVPSYTQWTIPSQFGQTG